MMKKIFHSAFLILFSFFLHAKNFEFNNRCREAYTNIFALRFENARKIIQEEKYANPNNVIPYFLDNYIDFFTVAMNENLVDFRAMEKNKNERLDKIEQGDKNSPYYLYTKAEINIQFAIVHIKFGEYVSAFWEIRKAIKLLEQNQKKFPDFIPNNKSLGIIHALIGTVPDTYKWGVNLLGWSGTIEDGINELKTVVYYPKSTFAFQEEATVIYIFFLRNLVNNPEEAWRIVNSPELFSIKDNLLNHFLVANLAMHTGKNDECIRILLTRPSGNGYLDFPLMNYFLGICKLNALDDDAHIFLEKFTDEYHGENYLKDAYQKLAWHYLIKGNMPDYRKNINQCRLRGKAFLDGDMQALHEAKNGTPPNVLLLKARLLCDGGYFMRAIGLLNEKSTDDFSTTKDKIEFTYRAGRIYDLWGKIDKAIHYYEITLKNGRSFDFYFVANAALRLGMIYEKQGDKEKAKKYFNECLNMKPSEYADGLHQQAKAGLNRLKVKN